MADENLLLKWGTLKGWRFESDAGKALLAEYGEIGMSLGAMSQHDTPRQKEIICELIDLCDGSVTNDWSGEDYTNDRQAAKDYVMNYGKPKNPPQEKQQSESA